MNLDPSTGIFEFRGKSIPENSIEFYKPFFSWLDEYSAAPAPKTEVNIQLDYFNTSSAKVLADIFKKFETLNQSGKTQVTINWRHNEEDDDMLEAGEDYKSISNLPFNLIAFN
jgi:hypothetical protein